MSGAVVKDDAARPLIACPPGDSLRTIVHDEARAPLDVLRYVLRQHRRIQIVLGTEPDARVVLQRFHTMLVAGMVPSDFAERIGNRRGISHESSGPVSRATGRKNCRPERPVNCA